MPAELATWLLAAALAAGAESPASELPDAEMLEFLGTFENNDEPWIDPVALDGNDPAGIARETLPREEKQP